MKLEKKHVFDQKVMYLLVLEPSGSEAVTRYILSIKFRVLRKALLQHPNHLYMVGLRKHIYWL